MPEWTLRGLPRPEVGTAAPVVIAQTGWGDAGQRERARAAGFDEHLVKPVTSGSQRPALAPGGGKGALRIMALLTRDDPLRNDIPERWPLPRAAHTR
jgi:CheY-like chemotaxis protein